MSAEQPELEFTCDPDKLPALQLGITAIDSKRTLAIRAADTWRQRSAATPEPISAACAVVAGLYDKVAEELTACVGLWVLAPSGDEFRDAASRVSALRSGSAQRLAATWSKANRRGSAKSWHLRGIALMGWRRSGSDSAL